LQEHSTLFLNKHLLAKWGAGPFGEAEIGDRGFELAKLTIQVWPGPGKL
jgi:hypothetical protein